MKKRMLAFLAAFGIAAVGSLALASPASAAETPQDTERPLIVQVNGRDDSGTGSPTVWAKDTFQRSMKITTDKVPFQAAELKTAQVPPLTDVEQICEMVKDTDLRWTYKIHAADSGTFVTTNNSATGSPGAGAPLVKDATGAFNGGFQATVVAPAFWCSYDSEKVHENPEEHSSSQYPALIFGGETDSELTAWGWTYSRCTDTKYVETSVEQWVNAKDGNTGDILGTKCEEKPPVTPPATPPVTDPPVSGGGGGGKPLLPVTGSEVAVISTIGGAVLLVGAVMFIAARKRRIRTVA